MKHKYQILLAISILSFLTSIMLSVGQSEQVFCGINSGCDIVKNSSYNYTLGIQNSYYGIAVFGILSILLFSQIKKHNQVKKKLINISIVLGSIAVLYFLYVQAFVLHAYCKYCLIVDIAMILALIITLISWRD